ncbi:hypothetical protein H6P81_004425 [Aristolochia fimbriata]|uniref:Chlororespiratory reduction 4 n=1 Tax=Aristolochia fimbriata TaxID=158543 RepID=A0AAV7FI11_ARIFI|nr:hypothetical protein H6P81_004425 [Aristolochia fimbriata]
MLATSPQQQRSAPAPTCGTLPSQRGTDIFKFRQQPRINSKPHAPVRLSSSSNGEWDFIIRNYSNSADPVNSILLYYHLLVEGGFLPTHFTFPSLLKACRRLSGIIEGRQIHGQTIKRGLAGDIFVQRALIRLYSKLGKCEDASRIFHRGTKLDIVSQNDIISGYVNGGDLDSARMVFDAMVEKNVVTWTVMVDGYAKHGRVDIARELFDEMPERNTFSWNTMLSGYMKHGQVLEAQKLFERMGQKDVVTWTVMISGYTQSCLFKEALEMFLLMRSASIEPNEVTIVSVLPAIAHLGTLTHGKWVHAFVKKKGMHVDGVLGSALVDMYSKCGCIDDALQVFNKLQRKEPSAWNSIISGFASHGFGREACCIFTIMKEESSIHPNDITFVAILNACSHAGLVDEGKLIFHEMINVYKVNPNVRHYGCMVDLLGRAGRLKEARQLIEEMPIEPNLVLWKTLLGACRIHKDFVLADEIAGIVAKLAPQDGGFYALAASVFAEAGQMDNMCSFRLQMNDLNIKKIAGYSWLELDGVVHEFQVGGESFHPQGKEINSMVDKLAKAMWLEGYEASKCIDTEDWG